MAPFFLHNFFNYLQTEKRFSEHTCSAYRVDINQFLEFSNVSSEEILREISKHDIRGWVIELLSKEYSKRSVNRKLYSLRTFFNWLIKNEFITTNPIQKIQGPKSDKKLPGFARVSDLSISKMDEIYNDVENSKRNRLIIELFYQTGIRLSELIYLKIEYISIDFIKVLGKRNKERIIPISLNLYNLINEYILSNNLKGRKNEFLFVLESGKNIYPKLVYRIINSYLGHVTNLDKCSPHVLRHTFATHMLNNGAGLETLKNLLGHASLTATQVYTHNSFTQLTNIYSQAHPRGHKKR